MAHPTAPSACNLVSLRAFACALHDQIKSGRERRAWAGVEGIFERRHARGRRPHAPRLRARAHLEEFLGGADHDSERAERLPRGEGARDLIVGLALEDRAHDDAHERAGLCTRAPGAEGARLLTNHRAPVGATAVELLDVPGGSEGLPGDHSAPSLDEPEEGQDAIARATELVLLLELTEVECAPLAPRASVEERRRMPCRRRLAPTHLKQRLPAIPRTNDPAALKPKSHGTRGAEGA